MHIATSVIRAEHRTLAAVLHGMLGMAADCAERGAKPNFATFHAMLDYITDFPDRYHHPKEDRYLFRLLRMRSAEGAAIIDRLMDEHIKLAHLMDGLRHALRRYEAAPEAPAAAETFRAELEAYAEFQWAHMRCEEESILPLAETHLTDDDWQELNDAFLGHSDPLIGPDGKSMYERMFKNIVTTAAPPFGVGEILRKSN